MTANMPPDRNRDDLPGFDLASIFLGPKAENAEIFERLLLDAFRDHVFWRRNHHPEDGFLVEESEKYERGYERSTSVLRQELLGLLSELKAGVPFFSQRYVAHMASDLTMASLLGYFATMLYNPNNVSVEASPVTTRMELEVAAQLARMIGYDPVEQWGHLTSGGTIANYEALWVARNVKYLPVAIHWAAREAGIDPPVELPNGDTEGVASLDLWRLLNIAPPAALDLLDRFRESLDEPERVLALLDRHSLGGLGYQEFGLRLAAEFGDALAPAVVLVPSTAHYSWTKICRSLGIGGSSVRFVPVDRQFRMDVDALDDTLRGLSERRQPVIACVSVIGTTEESAVDRFDRIAALRDEAQRDLGIAFHLHADAAYGGYAAAITRNRDGSRAPAPPAAEHGAGEWPSLEVYDALCALERADSVTIDPHKLGYVPYPAGAVSFRDRRGRNLVSVDAPVVFHRGESEWGSIGRYILEGSKPGAAAAGVWMSHQVLPLDAEGYGRLIRATAGAARRLHDRLGAHDWSPFRIVRLPAPDINLVCYAFSHPSLTTLGETNALVERLHRSLSVGTRPRGEIPEYYVTTTTLRPSEYGSAALPIVHELGFGEEDYLREGGVSVIRCTVMNPFLAGSRGRTDHIAGLIATLEATLAAQLG